MPPLKPMLAKSAPELPEAQPGTYWFEPKWDGFRCIVFRDGDEVELGSRNERPLTRYVPEPLDRMEKHGILIDGEGVVDGGETRILLQIFSKTVIGPIFFEFIQRKGDDGFGEGNFKALFESIEAEQIANGEIAAE